MKELSTCFKICFRKEGQILGLNSSMNKKRFKIVLQRYYKTKENDFQIYKNDFANIVTNQNIF